MASYLPIAVSPRWRTSWKNKQSFASFYAESGTLVQGASARLAKKPEVSFPYPTQLRVVGYFEACFSNLTDRTYQIKQHINAKRIGATSLKSRFSL